MTFVGLLLFWKANAWFRWLCLAAALCAAWFYFKEHYKAEGRKEGIQQATDTIARDNEKRFEQMRQEFQAQNAQYQAQIEALKVQLSAYQEAAKVLSSQRQQAAVTVAGMNEAQIDAKIEAEFGKRLEQFTLEDKRKVAQCSEQLSYCDQQKANAEQQITNLGQTLQTKDQQYALLGAYTSNVESAYVQEFNANRHKKRSPKCLWLWRCGVDQIDQQHLPALLSTRPVQ